MGSNKNEQERVNGNKRERAAAARERKRRSQGDYELTPESWLWLAALTQALVKEGGALRIGLTRDRGALALGVYLGNDYTTEYIRPSEDLAEAAMEIAEAWLENGQYKLEMEIQSFQMTLKMP